jgi:hypothetical protein
MTKYFVLMDDSTADYQLLTRATLGILGHLLRLLITILLIQWQILSGSHIQMAVW